jgi:hypothetical protein
MGFVARARVSGDSGTPQGTGGRPKEQAAVEVATTGLS